MESSANLRAEIPPSQSFLFFGLNGRIFRLSNRFDGTQLQIATGSPGCSPWVSHLY
jgi:hypothetical protein